LSVRKARPVEIPVGVKSSAGKEEFIVFLEEFNSERLSGEDMPPCPSGCDQYLR
jgi:hypothetical protein